MRFDPPAIRVPSIDTTRKAGTTCLAIEARKTLLFLIQAIITAADAASISITSE